MKETFERGIHERERESSPEAHLAWRTHRHRGLPDRRTMLSARDTPSPFSPTVVHYVVASVQWYTSHRRSSDRKLMDWRCRDDRVIIQTIPSGSRKNGQVA